MQQALSHVGVDQGLPEHFCDQLPDQPMQHADDYYRRQCHALQESAWIAGEPVKPGLLVQAYVSVHFAELECRLLWGLHCASESKTVELV